MKLSKKLLLIVPLILGTETATAKGIVLSMTSIPASKSITPVLNQGFAEEAYFEARYELIRNEEDFNNTLALAAGGDSNAQLEIGSYYADGHGVATSDVAALMWYIIANESGNKNAKNKIKTAEMNMTGDRIRLAKKLADKWLKMH